MLSILKSRDIQVFVLALTLVMSILSILDLRNAEPALLSFNVESSRTGQLKVLYEKDGVLVDPGWLIPLREGVVQRAEFPLEMGAYNLLGFKPYSSGEVRISQQKIRIQDVEKPLGGGFVAINQLEVLPGNDEGVTVRGSAGATDPFGVFHGLKIEVPPGRITALGFLTTLAAKLMLVALAFVLLFLVFGRDALFSEADKQRGAFPGAGRFFGIVAFGVFVLYLRNVHSITFPILYTEDGTWMAGLFERGFWDMLFNAKEGHARYFVFINVLILQLAKTTNSLFVGDSLEFLPHLVSLYTTLFYALLAAAPLYLLRSVMRLEARVLLWALILLVPLGSASFEVLGRASNVGYGVLFLAFCLLVYRRTITKNPTPYVYGVDFLLFLCANTNPLCYPLIFVFFAIQTFVSRPWSIDHFFGLFRVRPSVRSATVLCLTLVGFAAWMVLREKGPDSALAGDLKISTLCEAFFARAFLFAFVFPVYEHLNNSISIGLSFVAMLFLWWWLKGGATRERRLALYVVAIFILTISVTLISRPALTNVLNNYTTTFVDRYYFGVTYFVLLLFCLGFSAAWGGGHRLKSIIASFVCGGLVAIYIGSSGYLFEFDRPRWFDLPQQSFRDSLSKSYADTYALERGEGESRYQVSLHPKPWMAYFPEENVLATLRDGRGFFGTVLHSDEQSKFRLAVVSKYEGKVVRQPSQNRGREDGWFFVKDGRRTWISGPKWLEENGISSSDVIEISSDEFSLIPDSGTVLN